MFEIREHSRAFADGTKITTCSREVINGNLLEIEAGTTGYRGGDDCRTCFSIRDLGDTIMKVRKDRDRYGTEEFEVSPVGDCELETMIRALKFIVKVLEEESKEVYD